MPQKFQRVFRDRSLNPDEVAKDEVARSAIQNEFPPLQSTAEGDSLTEVLRRAIRESARSADEIAEEAHVSPTVVSRFLAGERDIHLETADRLAGVLGVKVATGM